MDTIKVMWCIFFFSMALVCGYAQNASQPILLENTLSNKKERQQIPAPERRLDYYRNTRGLDMTGAPQNYDQYKAETLRKVKKQIPKSGDSHSRSNSGEWQSDGPTGFSNYTSIGRVSRMEFHNTNPDIIYAATAGGGLWYTPNHGLVWYPMTDHIPNINLSDVVIDHYDPDVLYVLTGDGDGSSGSSTFSRRSTGVLKSTDHGDTWFKTGLVFDETQNVNAYNMIMDPINAGVIFVASEVGVFRTSNYGVTWVPVLSDWVYEVLPKPGDSQTMYAIGRQNFYRSNTNGITWDIVSTIPMINGLDGRMTMATCENDEDRVYVYAAPKVDSLGLHRGFFVSDNQGDDFTKIDSTTNLDGLVQGWYDLAMLCSAVNSDDVIIGKVRTYTSDDGGDSFTFSDGLHADHHEYRVNPLRPNRVYAATDGGIYYSDDFGASNTWTYISEYSRITQYYKIAVSQSNPHMVAGGSQDNGTHINYDANAVFFRALGKDGMDCAIHPTDDNLMIMSSQDGEFHMSDDAGATTYPVINENQIASNATSQWVTPIAWDPNDPNNIYLGYEPIYRSDDGGGSFSQIPDTVGGNMFLHVGTANPARLYASDFYNGEFHIHRSDDFGTNWTPIHQTMDSSVHAIRKTAVTTNPDNSDEVWVTFAGFTDSLKVFRSINQGLSWSNETGSLPNIPINCIVYQDTNDSPSGAVYIGTDIGVFYKNDDIEDWIYFSNELPAVEITDLEIQYSSGTLYAGTYGRGIWTTDLYSECPNQYFLNSATLLPERDYFFQASDSIVLHDYSMEGLGAHMKLVSDNVILIHDNFVAKSNNENLFKARLAPCGGGIESLQNEDDDVEKDKK